MAFHRDAEVKATDLTLAEQLGVLCGSEAVKDGVIEKIIDIYFAIKQKDNDFLREKEFVEKVAEWYGRRIAGQQAFFERTGLPKDNPRLQAEFDDSFNNIVAFYLLKLGFFEPKSKANALTDALDHLERLRSTGPVYRAIYHEVYGRESTRNPDEIIDSFLRIESGDRKNSQRLKFEIAARITQHAEPSFNALSSDPPPSSRVIVKKTEEPVPVAAEDRPRPLAKARPRTTALAPEREDRINSWTDLAQRALDAFQDRFGRSGS